MATAEANDVDVEHDEQPFILPVRLDKIRLDGGTQLRVTPNPATVDEYAEAMGRGDRFPPPDVYFDGEHYWPADGHQRIEAARKAGLESLECRIHGGTLRDAIGHAVGANTSHGDRRTQADARNAVETMLRDLEWGKLSDREIARRCGVSHTTVAKYRDELSGKSGQIDATRTVCRNGTTYTQDTSRIGSRPSNGDDPPDVAEGRRNGTIPPDVPVQVDEPPQWVECETEGIDPADMPPERELTDEEWLESLPAREHLAEHVRARFDREALVWRATKAIRDEFGRQIRPHLRQLDRDQKGHRGVWRSRMGFLLEMNDPSRWLSCSECEGTGDVQLIGMCPTCHRHGYLLR